MRETGKGRGNGRGNRGAVEEWKRIEANGCGAFASVHGQSEIVL